MNHKGVEYSIARAEPGVWQWRFQIGETVRAGRTQTNLAGVAAHTVRQQIDRELEGLADPSGNRQVVSKAGSECATARDKENSAKKNEDRAAKLKSEGKVEDRGEDTR